MEISKIKLNPNNPRLIKDDKFKKLVQSIKDFPEMLEIRPIVVNKDMIILGGNMRYKACKEAGLKDVPVTVVDLTEDQQREFLIKDNTSGGEWDWEVLANEWDTEQLESWGLDLPVDFNAEELEAEEDDFEVPEGGIETDIVLGDLFEIGEHRLLCGDSTQTDTFEKLMQGEFADMCVTDPPYNVAYEGKTKDALTIENDSMGNDDFYKFLYDFYTACNSFIKKGGAWYVWHADLEGVNFRKAFKDAGIKLSSVLIWNKNTLVMGRGDFHWKHEPCLYGWKEGAAHNWYSDRKQTTIIDFDKPQRNGEHPTMKPIGLFSYQIENSSKVGDIVIDAFGGSGTTMVACQQINRKARVIEFDPRYCQVIIDRMKKLDPQLEIKRNGIRQN
ncbi:MAG: DNA modification methylase [Flavobacterium sp.]|nr:DNA modification methylase [Flavobacterium sp.]